MSDFIDESLHQPGLPPEQVQVIDLQTESWQDKKRIRVLIELTPFQVRPDLEISIFTLAGDLVSKVDIIENLEPKVVFTMHFREDPVESSYRLAVKILYRDIGCVHENMIVFNLV